MPHGVKIAHKKRERTINLEAREDCKIAYKNRELLRYFLCAQLHQRCSNYSRSKSGAVVEMA